MKLLTSLPITLLFFNTTFSQKGNVNTSGDNRPAVIAKNFSVTYGVRADAIEAILWIYEAEGYDVERRIRATEQILRDYTQSPEKQQRATGLSVATQLKMGISNAPKITSALEWDLFAREHYLSTTGINSPAVVAKGDVNIWYGISPKTLRALAAQLEKNKMDFTNFETQLVEQAKKYEELKIELETYGSQEKVYQQAEALLEEGKLEEAEQLIEADFDASMKRQTYKGYIFGKTKELIFKYEEAAKGYKNAINNSEDNSIYHHAYAYIENILAHYDEAIIHYEIALGIDSLKNGSEERIGILLNNLGGAWSSKGAYDKAIGYFGKALEIDLKTFGEDHPNVANGYNNHGRVWYLKGDYGKAINYFEKALEIDLKAFGENHPSIALGYDNLGAVLNEKGEHDQAIDYFEKALQIDLKAFGENYPNVAVEYSNLGGAWNSKGEYDKAIDYFEKALQIDFKTFGENHPNVAIDYNNLGGVWDSKRAYDKAIEYFEKALQIDLKAFGENHPNIAYRYNNLGGAWYSKGSYDKAIAYFDKCQAIFDQFIPPTHPNQRTVAENLSRAANSRGIELSNEKKYQEALEYFQKALRSKRVGDNVFLATCLNNIGSMQKHLKEYEEALQSLNEGLQILAQLNQKLDQEIKKRLTSEMLNKPEEQAKIAEKKNLFLICRIQYHKLGCLKGLKKEKEAKTLAKRLWQEGIKINDTRLLEDLRKEGYDFKKKN